MTMEPRTYTAGHGWTLPFDSEGIRVNPCSTAAREPVVQLFVTKYTPTQMITMPVMRVKERFS